MASSLSELTYGIIMIPMTIPALSMLNPGSSGITRCSNGVTNSSAKKPNTTVGTALNNSRMGFKISRTLALAYSLK